MPRRVVSLGNDAIDPGIKGEARAREKMQNDYDGDPTQLKDLARNRLITVLYESGAYDRTVEEGHVFIDKYPDSNFLVNVLYNVGWAHFETGHYEESIAAFEDLVRRFGDGCQALQVRGARIPCFGQRDLDAPQLPLQRDPGFDLPRSFARRQGVRRHLRQPRRQANDGAPGAPRFTGSPRPPR